MYRPTQVELLCPGEVPTRCACNLHGHGKGVSHGVTQLHPFGALAISVSKSLLQRCAAKKTAEKTFAVQLGLQT